MRKIEVCIRGQNFLMKTADGTKKRGFYAARFIEARDISSAVEMAMDSFRETLKGQVLNGPNDPPAMKVLDASEVYFFQDSMLVEGRTVPGEGFLWDDAEDTATLPTKPPWTANWQTLKKQFKEKDMHTHSMLIHFTSGLFPVTTIFMFLALVLGSESFSDAYIYVMALATLSAPVSFVSGWTEWKKRYEGAKKPIFYNKIKYGAVMSVIGLICNVWYIASPSVLTDPGFSTLPFVLLNLGILPFIVYLGHLGSVIVYEGLENQDSPS